MRLDREDLPWPLCMRGVALDRLCQRYFSRPGFFSLYCYVLAVPSDPIIFPTFSFLLAREYSGTP